MMFKERIIGSAAVCVWIGVMVAALAATRMVLDPGRFSPAENIGTVGNNPAIEQALQAGGVLQQRVYTGNFENPFKPARTTPHTPSRGPAYNRIALIIKGVLLKDRPLAIFAGENGEKIICGVGDTVSNQIVIKITGEGVTLRDSRGTYTLATDPQ